MIKENPHNILMRFAEHFNEEGLYVKEDLCYSISEYIEKLEKELHSLTEDKPK